MIDVIAIMVRPILGYWDAFQCVEAHGSLSTLAILYSIGTPTGGSITCKDIIDLSGHMVATIGWLSECFSSV